MINSNPHIKIPLKPMELALINLMLSNPDKTPESQNIIKEHYKDMFSLRIKFLAYTEQFLKEMGFSISEA